MPTAGQTLRRDLTVVEQARHERTGQPSSRPAAAGVSMVSVGSTVTERPAMSSWTEARMTAARAGGSCGVRPNLSGTPLVTEVPRSSPDPFAALRAAQRRGHIRGAKCW